MSLAPSERRAPDRVLEGPLSVSLRDVSSLIRVLEHGYPNPAGSDDVRDIKYVHFLAMRSYIDVDLVNDDAREDLLQQAAEVLEYAISGESPPPDSTMGESVTGYRLQQALWTSLSHWRKSYDQAHQVVLGKYWLETAMEHLRRYGRLFRPEFLFACLWNRTAAIYAPHMEEIISRSEQRVTMLRQAIVSLRESGKSVVAGLCDIANAPFLPWWDCDFDPMCDGFPVYNRECHLSNDEERQLGESLVRVFLHG